MYSATVDVKDLHRRRDILSNLLNMSRAQRRARGVKATQAQIQQELGGVQYVIEKMSTPVAGSNGPDGPATDAAGPNGNRLT